MKIIYFLQGRATIRQAELPDLKLDYAFESAQLAQRSTTAGPSGPGGVLFGSSSEGLEYTPENQSWAKAADYGHDCADLWLGYSKVSPPVAADFARKEMVEGYIAKLEMPGGAEEFIIPLGRVFPEGTKLPRSLALGPNRTIVKKVIPRLAWASDRAAMLWDQFRRATGMLEQGETVEELSPAEEFEIACEVLSINYRLSPVEISMFGLLTTANIQDVIFLFVDMPMYATSLKKVVEGDSKKNS